MSFEPWIKYPSLTLERLVKVADVVRRTRKSAADLHDSDSGDSSWSLGCRAYSRICHVLRQTSRQCDWLGVLKDHQYLRFTFTIGQVPLRFYRGDPDDPPARSSMVAYRELRQRQIALDLGVPLEHNEILRLAIETDQRGYVSRVTLVELTENDNEVTMDLPPGVRQTVKTLLTVR